MFERYTEKARRLIFFARYEASQFGMPYIETEHLLLGLLREDKALTNRFLRSRVSVEAIRKEIEAHTTIREKVSTSVDLPLSKDSKRVLAYAAEEAERLGHKYIGTEHLLLGILREEKCFAATILSERGLKLGDIREELARSPHTTKVDPPSESTQLSELSRDLTQAALANILEPVVGRNRELDGLIEILCRRDRKNPILIGESGVGKTAIVEGLAQRIADGVVPPFLADKRILAFDPRLITGSIQVRETDGSEVILFIDDLKVFLSQASISRSPNDAGTLKSVLLRGEMQCIAATTPSKYRAFLEVAPWLGDCFRTVHVHPLDEESTLRVLQTRKRRYEEFYEVTYSDDALECVARSSGQYLAESSLPGKALELLDAAGARVKLCRGLPPEEIAEVQKRIRFIVHRMENAIVNHEFEKAKFYSEEERKERWNLRELREKYQLDDSTLSVVSREDVEETIKRWAEYPFQP
jgi:ATP-dependent Clp protease ATP-binding subunit ClpC